MQEAFIFLAGTSIGLCANFIVEAYRYHNEKKSIAAIVFCDVEAALLMAKIREHERFYRDILTQLENGNDVNLKGMDVVGDLNQYEQMIRANISKLGILGADAVKDLNMYLHFLTMVRIDIKDLAMNDYSMEQKIQRIRDGLDLWMNTKGLAEIVKSKMLLISNKKFLWVVNI